MLLGTASNRNSTPVQSTIEEFDISMTKMETTATICYEYGTASQQKYTMDTYIIQKFITNMLHPMYHMEHTVIERWHFM